MDIRRFTMIAGILFVLVGIAGFVPGLTTMPRAMDPAMTADMAYGRLFGLFPVNWIHNVVHLAFGVWALAASKNFVQSRIYCRASSIIYGVLTVAGLIPGLNTMFGLVPLHSHDVWLHAVIAIGAAYFGYVKVSDEDQLGAPRMGRRTTTTTVNNAGGPIWS